MAAYLARTKALLSVSVLYPPAPPTLTWNWNLNLVPTNLTATSSRVLDIHHLSRHIQPHAVAYTCGI